jgi:sucrose-6F-phosphate phosphohydrolase
MNHSRFEWMLVSDLDGTLLGDDASLSQFKRRWETQVRPHACLVYTSGRFIASMRESVQEKNLPEPDFWIGGVGTQIEGGDDKLLRDWRRQLEEGWNRGVAIQVLAHWPGVKLQPSEFLSEYKISGYWRYAAKNDLDRLCAALADSGCNARVLYSSDRDVDVLPSRANKGTSAAHVASALGLSPSKVICSGDSGNDADLFQMGFGGNILVGNAAPDLVDAAPGAYRAQASYAGGVLEGLRHFGRL